MTSQGDPADARDPPEPPPRSAPIPHFDVALAAPDLTAWQAGNTGLAGVTSFTAAAPGPHVVLMALTHGNEIAGAIVLDRLLRAGLRPARGRLTFGFANLAAFAVFDPAQPTTSRFVDEDLNRVWDMSVLDGHRRSVELDRARALRGLLDTADILLDLHSMLWPSEPLILCGSTQRGAALARTIGVPALVVADRGHLSGLRMIDYGRFAEARSSATAVLIEAGQHWQANTVTTMAASVDALLGHAGMIDGPLVPAADDSRLFEVTDLVTAATSSFAFVRAFHGGEVVPRRNTVIALDGDAEIRTPYDNCLLVMPSLRSGRGHTAVRLARRVG